MNHYEKFHTLHQQDGPLILANAWNARSAQIIEAAGFEAIGTSSGAIAESLGYKDGEQIPFEELLYIVRRIKSVLSVPLSVDMERGYTNDLNALNDNIQKLLDIGVAGINLEDAQGEEIYLKKLSGIKNYLLKTNQHLFINARTDGFLQKLDSPLETTLKRARLYQDNGADGLFVTGMQDPAIIKQITAATTLPINIVAGPKLSSVETLVACGVRRISMAVFLYKATYAKTEKLAGELLQANSFAPLY